MQSDVFFFISSVGFVILFFLLGVALFYAIRAFRTWDRILDKLEKNIGSMGDTAQEMVEDVRDSSVFRFLTMGKKKHAKSKSKN